MSIKVQRLGEKLKNNGRNSRLCTYSCNHFAALVSHYLFFRVSLKTHLIRKEVNRLKKEYHAQHYVGIAADESDRVKGEQYPLVEWNITEAEALKISCDRGFDWGGLYEIYHRCSSGAVRSSESGS